MLDVARARALAEEWIAAWNAHDLDRILSHYADDFEMTSPHIVERMGEPSGRLRGKTSIRIYWERALVAEVLGLDDAGRVVRGSAHYAPRP